MVKEEKFMVMIVLRSVKFGKDIFGFIIVDVVLVVGNKFVNRILGGWDRFRFNVRRNFIDDIFFDKVFDIFSGGFVG